MSKVLGYLHWKIAVLNILREHRGDKNGPLLTVSEQRLLEESYERGASPEEYVESISGVPKE